MKKNGILNPDLSRIIASMGHFDLLTVSDAGLPIPLSVERVDLSISENLPGILDVVSAIAIDLKVQRIVIAEEAIEKNPKIIKGFKEIFPDIEIDFITHESFKLLTQKSRAIIRSGECSPYANVILESGVIF